MHENIDLRNNIKLISTVVTIAFFISGYFYNFCLLWQFSIYPSGYFTLNDYIASSLDQIIFTLIGLGIGVFLYILQPRSKSTNNSIFVPPSKKRI